ncbi:MAG TPA: sensor histidine kinase [Candidatus Eisenbacteria bacterium]|nr:sensor histidine kinase [Candidatus Eisenbacteria bacterium]
MQFPQTLDEPAPESIVHLKSEPSARKIAGRDVPRPGEHTSVVVPVLLALAVLVMVGVADYLTGHEILFSIFYLVPVAVAAWYVGSAFASILAVASVGVWLIGDRAAGAAYSHPFVLVWNFAITLAFYFVVVMLMRRLRAMQHDLESRVRARTAALTEEIAERQRLEVEILEIGERERSRIGRDLHDSLGQILTGTALAGQVLQEKLGARGLGEAEDARRLVAHVEDAIEFTRSLSRGLDPLDVEGGGIAEAIEELVERTNGLTEVRCLFQTVGELSVLDRSTATHLYRIAQEAMTNALKHGHPTTIIVRLDREPRHIRLTILDNGVGIPDLPQRRAGLGMRIMARRAAMIGGSLSVWRGPKGQTTVECRLPEPL